MPGPAVSLLRFVAVSQDDRLAEPLLAELAVEYSTRYGGTPAQTLAWLHSHPAHEFEPPGGGLLIGLMDGHPVTGGAFQRFDEETAELKRIWTDSSHRQRGFGKALLAALESEIAGRGYRRVYLTTGHLQPEAEALYQATGYRRLTEPLPADGTAYPIAFSKAL